MMMRIERAVNKRALNLVLLIGAIIFLIFSTQMADAKSTTGRVLNLDGAGDSGKTAGSPADLDITGAITLQCYFYKDSTVDYATASFDMLIFKAGAYQLRLEWITDTTAKIRGLVTTGAGNQIVETTAQTFNDSTWYNIGFTRSGANGEVFLDASSIASSSSLDTGAGISNGNPVYVGDNAGGSASAAGYMDEVRISNAVIDIVTEGNPETFSSVASTQALYRFDEVNGSTSFADIAGTNDTLSQVGNAVTLIELSGFKAVPKGKKIIVKWKTDSETYNEGFNILRSDSKKGEYVVINDYVIPAEGNDAIGVAKYNYPDKDVEIGGKYFYKLVDIDISSVETEHGPVKAKLKKKNKRQKKHKKNRK